MGEQASYALFRYAAGQEGRAVGSRTDPDRFADAMKALNGTFVGQTSQVVEDEPDRVLVRVFAPATRATASACLDGLFVGWFEGVLTESRHHPFEGRVAGRGDEAAPVLLLEFRRTDGGE